MKSVGAQRVGLLVLSGKQGEVFVVQGAHVQRVSRITPALGTAPASASRRGGQSAPRFSRLADSARLAWVKKFVETVNAAFTADNARCGVSSLLVCGGEGLKTLLASDQVQKDVHHTLRPLFWYCPSKTDPMGKDAHLKKVAEGAGGKVGTTLADHEVIDVAIFALRNGAIELPQLTAEEHDSARVTPPPATSLAADYS
jgi:hypothetical protein